MNIINIVNGVIEKNIDNYITCTKKNDNTYINIKNNIEFCLYVENENCEDTINITINKNLSVRIFLIMTINNNLNINIDIFENSKLLLNRFTNAKSLDETININLKKINSTLEYYHSCLGDIKEKLSIYHDSRNTNSIVKTYGISNNNIQEFNIIEKVSKGNINCKLSQKSKIINLGNNNSTIRPILLIDEKEVTAFHSSVISPINKNDLFYLMSRGIKEDDSIRLLTNGFLINNLNLNNEEKHLLFEKYIFRR